jgi:hypothetical protein
MYFMEGGYEAGGGWKRLGAVSLPGFDVVGFEFVGFVLQRVFI